MARGLGPLPHHAPPLPPPGTGVPNVPKAGVQRCCMPRPPSSPTTPSLHPTGLLQWSCRCGVMERCEPNLVHTPVNMQPCCPSCLAAATGGAPAPAGPQHLPSFSSFPVHSLGTMWVMHSTTWGADSSQLLTSCISYRSTPDVSKYGQGACHVRNQLVLAPVRLSCADLPATTTCHQVVPPVNHHQYDTLSVWPPTPVTTHAHSAHPEHLPPRKRERERDTESYELRLAARVQAAWLAGQEQRHLTRDQHTGAADPAQAPSPVPPSTGPPLLVNMHAPSQ
jgi:hypothetical protein